MRKPAFLWLLLSGIATCLPAADVPQWSVQELSFESSRTYRNAYVESDFQATFTGPGQEKLTVAGFWDGGRTFKVRWTPTAPGRWSYVTRSADPELGDRSGKVTVLAPAAGSHGFLRRDPANPYSFVFDDSTRFFLFGTTHYEIVANAAAGDRWKTAVDKTRQYGMNKIRFSLARMAEVQDQRNPYRSSLAFAEKDQDRLKVAHWAKVDEVVRYLADRGIIADLIVFQRGLVDSATEEQNRHYLRYVVSRYAAFPNVVFCLVNEWNYTTKPLEFWDAMGRLASQMDPWARRGGAVRGLSVHQQTRYDFMLFKTSQDWLSHAIVQLGVRNRGKALRGGDEWNLAGRDTSKTMRYGDDWGNFSIAYNWGHNMPVVNDEYGYIGEPQDATEPKTADGKFAIYSREKHRRTMWGIYAAGGYGSGGDKNLYADGSPYVSANWHDAPEFDDIKHLIGFYTQKSLQYWRLEGHNEIFKSGERVYAAADPGRQYVIYAAAGGSFSVELPKGTYAAHRFDPRTGNDVVLPAVQGGTARFQMPDAQDWVVLLLK